MGAETKLFAIPLDACGFNAAKVCWGTCGHGQIGAIVLEGHGEAIPCIVPSAQCPHFESETTDPVGTVDDGRDGARPVYLRKLSPVAHKIRQPLRFYVHAIRDSLRWWRLRMLPVRAWRYFFPLPPECRACGAPCFTHKELPPKTEGTLLDMDGFYGSRLRVEADEMFITVIDYDCDGSVRDSLLLLESDAESLRDALDRALERMR